MIIVCAKCGFPFEGDPSITESVQGIAGGAEIGICANCDPETIGEALSAVLVPSTLKPSPIKAG